MIIPASDTEEDRRSSCVTIPNHPRFLKNDQTGATGIESEKTDTETTKTGIETGMLMYDKAIEEVYARYTERFCYGLGEGTWYYLRYAIWKRITSILCFIGMRIRRMMLMMVNG